MDVVRDESARPREFVYSRGHRARVYLCNHALHAHSVRYTSLERDTNAFRLELARGVSREPITISYGRLENVELVAYYGFSLANNPYDRLPFTIPGFDPSNIDDARAEALRRASAAAARRVGVSPWRRRRRFSRSISGANARVIRPTKSYRVERHSR